MHFAFLLFGIIIFNLNGIAQTDEKKDLYPKLDAVDTYALFLETKVIDGIRGFYVNGDRVKKNIYDRYTAIGDRFLQCKPCILKVYTTENVLISIGTRYIDCSVGDYTAFYPNGKIKIKGQYKQNDTGDWNNLYDRGYCSMMNGEWRYYSPWGHLLRIELYADGKLVSDTKAE